MAKGVNKVILIGNLGGDPEVKQTPSRAIITKFSVATSESWKNNDGEYQERTEWHSIVCFQRLAEICAEYLKKGSKVYIEGSLRTSSWEDKEGQKRYRTEIIAREMQMLGGKGGANQLDDDDIPFE